MELLDICKQAKAIAPKIGILDTNTKNQALLAVADFLVKEQNSILDANKIDIENGKKLPSTPALLALSDTLDCSIDWILKGESHNNENGFLSDEREEELLKGFRQLDQDDQDELMGLLSLKLRKVKRDGEKMETLSNSDDGEVSDKLA